MKVLLSLVLMMTTTECLGEIHSLVRARVNAQQSVRRPTIITTSRAKHAKVSSTQTAMEPRTSFPHWETAKRRAYQMYVNSRRSLATVRPVLVGTTLTSIAKNAKGLPIKATVETQTTFAQCKTAKRRAYQMLSKA